VSDGVFIHEALFYRDADEYLAGTLPFIDESLRADEPVLVAVPTASLNLLADALGGSAARVVVHDASEVARNPGRLIPWVYYGFSVANAEVRINIIGEPVWPGRTADEYPACVQHEALCNVIFGGRPSRALCPYDVSKLDPTAVADARTTHPFLVDAAGRRASPRYSDPFEVAAEFNQPLPDLGPPNASLRFDANTVGDVRRVVAQHAAYAGMDPERATALHVAVREVAVNSVAHGGGSGELRVYRTPDTLVCEISDSGWIADPLAGRIPTGKADPQSGLLLVHRLCDLVRTYTSPAGTTTRLYMGLAAAARSR